MSQTEHSKSEMPMAANAVDRDQLRVSDASQINTPQPNQPPYPKAERILKVTIPVNPDWTDSGKFVLPRDEERIDVFDIDPCGYIKPEFLENDKYLKKLLIQTPTTDSPQVNDTGRKLLNVDFPFVRKLYQSPQAPNIDLPQQKQFSQLQDIIDTHERDYDTVGSHAHALVNPRTRTMSSINNGFNYTSGEIYHENFGSLESFPSRSVIYNELYSIVGEKIGNPNKKMQAAIDNYRRQNGRQEYKRALNIIDWLRSETGYERFSYEQIRTLLNAARCINRPTWYLTHVLYDLANGMPLRDAIFNGSHNFNLDSTELDLIPKEMHVLKKLKNSDLHFTRLLQETVETVCFQSKERTIIKEWWVRDPPASFPLPVIRYILLNRLIERFSKKHFGVYPICTTAKQGGFIFRHDDGSAYKFQLRNNSLGHPYQMAMKGENIDRCKEALKHTSKEAFDNHRARLIATFADESLQFEDQRSIDKWMKGAAPADLPCEELPRWFQ